MKNVKIFIFTSISALLILTACERKIPLEGDNIDKRIVINSLFFADSTIKVELTNSAQIATEQYTNNIKNAKVSLFENGNLIEELKETPLGSYESTQTAKAGSTYTLKVNTPLGNATASSSIPEKIKVLQLDSAQMTRLTFDSWCGSENVYKMKLKFIDPPKDNFYILHITGIDTSNNYNNNNYEEEYENVFYYEFDYMMIGNDIDSEIYTNKYSYLKFPDEEFNNKIKTYTFGFKPLNVYSYMYILELYSIDYNFYQYITTLRIFDWVRYDFFSEPINVYSNIDGGIGIFAGASVIKLPIKLNPNGFYDNY